jgi:hypothetical protein
MLHLSEWKNESDRPSGTSRATLAPDITKRKSRSRNVAPQIVARQIDVDDNVERLAQDEKPAVHFGGPLIRDAAVGTAAGLGYR